MHAIAQALRASSLRSLSLEEVCRWSGSERRGSDGEQTALGDDGGVLLFAALHHCPSLQELV
jgi:hypothetical protein